jgi:NAD(P)-dependent dehydrogenase (short-subunit alcohol dehydrogenase family)
MKPEGTAVVTGASRGIGRAVAIELAARGFDTVATMRDTEAGRDLDGLRVERLDVTDPSTINLPAGLRVLVNNAGVESENLPVEMTPDDAWRRMFATNVFGLVEVTKHAVPLMREAGGGVICNITSSSTLAPVPFMATYRASKAAVTAIGESLAAEVAQFGIRVVEVMPGPIETDMLAISDRPAAAIEHAPYRALAEKMWEGRQNVRSAYTPADEAARRIVDAILDDDGPLRYGCDDLSEGMLAGWATTDNNQWVRGMLRSMSQT